MKFSLSFEAIGPDLLANRRARMKPTFDQLQRLIVCAAGIVFFCIGIWMLKTGISAKGAIDIKMELLSGHLETGSAGLFVIFFSFFLIILSFLLKHPNPSKPKVENTKPSRIPGMIAVVIITWATTVGLESDIAKHCVHSSDANYVPAIKKEIDRRFLHLKEYSQRISTLIAFHKRVYSIPRSIPTLASKCNACVYKDSGTRESKTDTSLTTPSLLSVPGLYSPTTRYGNGTGFNFCIFTKPSPVRNHSCVAPSGRASKTSTSKGWSVMFCG
jgi:hypothetical protein